MKCEAQFMKKIYTRDYDLEYTTNVANVPSYPIVSQLVDPIQSQVVHRCSIIRH